MNVETANRLQQLRKKNNLSQEELAEKIGISRQAVSKWERAEASPDTDNLILLARLYGVSLDELLRTESVHFADEDSISLRKEDYINETIPDDGEIYPNGNPFLKENGTVPSYESAPKQEDAPAQDDAKSASEDNVGEFVKNVAEFAVNVSKQAVKTTSEAMKNANESMKKGESMEKAIENSFERSFENFGSRMERMGERLEKKAERMEERFEKKAERMEERFEKKADRIEKHIEKKAKKIPATLLDKLYPFIIVILFVFFCINGWAHPMWMFFLTIPVYYIISDAYKKHRAGKTTFMKAVMSIFDGILPFAVVFLYIAWSSIFGHWHLTWMFFLLIPIYYIFSAALKKLASGRLSFIGAAIFFLNGSFPIIITMLFFLTGYLFGFHLSWILFLLIPVYYITADHFKKHLK